MSAQDPKLSRTTDSEHYILPKLEIEAEEVVGPAPFSARLAANLLDFLLGMAFVLVYQFILLAISARINFVDLVIQSALLFLTICVVNLLWVGGGTGLTVGKRLTGLRVELLDGQELGRARAIARATVGYVLSGLPLGLGFLWILWDSDGRAWHDKLFGSRVLKVQRI